MGRIISPVKKKINDHPLFTARLNKKVSFGKFGSSAEFPDVIFPDDM